LFHLFYTFATISDLILSYAEWWIAKDSEWDCHGQSEVLFWYLSGGTGKNHSDDIQCSSPELVQTLLEYKSRTYHHTTSWSDRRDWNKDLLSSNCMSYMCPCCSTNNPSGSDLGWKLSKATEVFWKKVVFLTNLEQMLQPAATNLNTKLTMTQEKLMCALKNARLLPDGCCCLNEQAVIASSGSTVGV